MFLPSCPLLYRCLHSESWIMGAMDVNAVARHGSGGGSDLADTRRLVSSILARRHEEDARSATSTPTLLCGYPRRRPYVQHHRGRQGVLQRDGASPHQVAENTEDHMVPYPDYLVLFDEERICTLPSQKEVPVD
uniref:Uncharacterized protein n=1 Tax=Arundo donax TaxID=35708 RepID=A0A0A9E3R1_ARUDO